MNEKHIMICDDQKKFRDSFEEDHEGYYKTTVVDDIRKLKEQIEILDKKNDLPDLLLIDLYHPIDDRVDIRPARDSLEDLKEQVKITNEAFIGIWVPTGLDLLKDLRKDFPREKLPIAIYTQKGLSLLKESEIRIVDKYDAHWVLKKNDENIYEKLRIDRIISEEKSIKASNASFSPNPDGKVFIVHGRNRKILNKITNFIELLNLESLILDEQPNQNQTIIEKFENCSEDVSFVVVLLTGDDVGKLNDKGITNFSFRARQNVIFEMGFFFAKMRKHVCLLYEEGVEIPSDIHGVLFIPIDNKGTWKNKLKKEMVSVGICNDV